MGFHKLFDEQRACEGGVFDDNFLKPPEKTYVVGTS